MPTTGAAHHELVKGERLRVFRLFATVWACEGRQRNPGNCFAFRVWVFWQHPTVSGVPTHCVKSLPAVLQHLQAVLSRSQLFRPLFFGFSGEELFLLFVTQDHVRIVQ